jgi:hypothetical protein
MEMNGIPYHGKATKGIPWKGKARKGIPWQGKEYHIIACMAWKGKIMARQGKA